MLPGSISRTFHTNWLEQQQITNAPSYYCNIVDAIEILKYEIWEIWKYQGKYGNMASNAA